MDVVEAPAEVANSMIESRHIQDASCRGPCLGPGCSAMASLCSLIACVCVTSDVGVDRPCGACHGEMRWTMLEVLKLALGCRLE